MILVEAMDVTILFQEDQVHVKEKLDHLSVPPRVMSRIDEDRSLSFR